MIVVLYTAKVRFFKQITTKNNEYARINALFCIPQRYDFSSKSQPVKSHSSSILCCFVYRKGTIFQANHNLKDTYNIAGELFCIPQRYDFSSKSQLAWIRHIKASCCFVYRKGTIFQANHN